MINLKKLIFLSILNTIIAQLLVSGPPFITDDPEPVEFKHWEYYISSMDQFQPDLFSGTLPHFEINYGVISNMQFHLEIPVNFNLIQQKVFQYGYANTEFGVKYRFIQESKYVPQIGVFPIIEIPTIKNNNFGNGKAQIFLPVWLQKSSGALTVYGGGGYCINPGTNNKNWFFTGLEVQYDFSRLLTFGCELYHRTAQAGDIGSETAFDIGGFINFSSDFHIIFSIGHSLTRENFYTSYLGFLWTI